MLTRRTFIRNIGAAGTLGLINPVSLWAAPGEKEIGIQLYSIRDLVAADLAGTLEKLRKIGYSTIETANYQDRKFYGHAPADFRSLVEGLGLRAVSSHSALSPDNIGQSVEDALAAGMDYVVLPSIPQDRRKTIDDYKQVAADLNAMGESCRAAGLTLGYHNHAFEFEKLEGRIPYDVLLEETDAGLVTMQLDTYWILYGGYSAEDYFRRFPGRFKMWHLKDMVAGESRESTEIGSGTIDFPALFEIKKDAGLECIIVEQEHFTMDPWESLAVSWNYINDL